MAGKNENSYLLVLFTILLVLILFEKSAKKGVSITKHELKNYAESEIIPEIKTNSILPEENELNENLPNDSKALDEIDPSIPEISAESIFPSKLNNENVSIYFLKFYGKGNKSHSRLVKTTRELDPNKIVNVGTILESLIKGPNAEEKSQGILSAIPVGLTFARNYKIDNNILHLSLGTEFEYGVGPELMQDRIDQIIFSLMELDEIKGVKLYINGKKITSIGGDGIPVPNVLTKKNRLVMTL